MSGTPEELFTCLEEFLQRVFSLAEVDAMDALVDLDVSFSQARTTFLLAHVAEPVPISVLARRLGLSQAAAGRNVDQLVRLGIAERQESPEDRRVKLVSLSPAGVEIADQHIEHKRRALRLVTERLPADDRERLIAALRPILAGDYFRKSLKEHVHGNG